MGMKLSGLVSNMDTDSLVEQLMAAQRTKVTKIENKKTKLTWTQDKWKDLNTKIYKLYTDELSKLRLQTSFSTFKASSSNESAVSVTTSSNAPIGSYNIAVNQLASSKIVTGDTIGDGTLTNSSNLVDKLNIKKGTIIRITNGTEKNPKKVIDFTVTSNSTIADFTKACQDAGLNANFDANNKRFFISGKNSGEENTFSISSYGMSNPDAEKARESVYDLFKINDTDSEDSIPLNIRGQIDTYLNEYKFAKDDSEKEAIVEKINITRTSYLKGVIAAELKKEDPEGEITADQINSKFTERYGDEATLKLKIKGFAEQYAQGYEFGETPNNLVNTALGIVETEKNTTKAQNSKIIYNGILYEQASNSLTINGLTINAKQVTDGSKIDGTTDLNKLTGVSVSITKDNQGTYDMVKNFIKSYNDILKEMNTLYYANSSRGYDPLTDDEKEAMTDDQIEKWETKIKDSLLRRDSTLGSLITAMKSSMNGSVKVTTKDGKESEYSLSRLGIMTSSDYSEKGLLHIYGDSDDSTFASETDKLMAALEDDPDAVMQTITGIAKNLYSTLTDKMKSTSLSSALTLYNDKQMDKQQTQYAKDIKALETKLEDMESSYYKKFSAMETALAKLQQNTSALSSLMGNSN